MATVAITHGQRGGDSGVSPPAPAGLTAPPRPPIPAVPSQIWLVSGRPAIRPLTKVVADFVSGMRLFSDGKYVEALPLLGAPGLASTPLAAHASFYTGLALLNLSRAAEARTVFARLHASDVTGYLSEAVIAREAEAAEAQADHAGAARLYEQLTGRPTVNPDALLLALGRAQLALGDRQRAADTFARLYYDHPLSDLAAVAATELDGVKDMRPPPGSPARFARELGRAERLFAARRHQAARLAFEALLPFAARDRADAVALRLAECDHYLRRFGLARDQLGRLLEQGPHAGEARFFYLTATRELGDHDEFVRLARALITDVPDSPWAEDALNSLATHYILIDEDEQADAAFREMYAKFPRGRHAERAAWKVGWWAYKHARYLDATTFFESAAAGFPRSDYRPPYLYWSARSRERAGDKPGALFVYRIVAADYFNSYYGRLAVKRLAGLGARPATAAAVGADVRAADAAAPSAEPPTSDLIRYLICLELYDQARDELLYAQRTGGDSPMISATLGWVYNRRGEFLRGILAMKRAYPQYMSQDGSRLPDDLLKVMFPLEYWPLIERYSLANGLDPYLVAALVNQESAFDAGAKSVANAIGLMQLLPSTGRRYARALRLTGFSAWSLTRPEVNIRLGTAYFAELVRRFGSVHCALAGYNAGEHRVAEWNAERPGIEAEEYTDDIPFPETQGYVKKVMGGADDYRRLYGQDRGATKPPLPAKPKTRGGRPAFRGASQQRFRF